MQYIWYFSPFFYCAFKQQTQFWIVTPNHFKLLFKASIHILFGKMKVHSPILQRNVCLFLRRVFYLVPWAQIALKDLFFIVFTYVPTISLAKLFLILAAIIFLFLTQSQVNTPTWWLFLVFLDVQVLAYSKKTSKFRSYSLAWTLK